MTLLKKKHRHRLTVRSEKDRCSWVECSDCRRRGPKKHSRVLAQARYRVAGFVT